MWGRAISAGGMEAQAVVEGHRSGRPDRARCCEGSLLMAWVDIISRKLGLLMIIDGDGG